MKIKPNVTAIAAADSQTAQAHFLAMLTFEADPFDVYQDMKHGVADFVLVDVRSPSAYKKSHAVGAVNIPHQAMNEKRMADYPPETLFVVYCTSSGCNGANKAALRLSGMGRPVKMMIGGITDWEDVERLPVVRS